MKTLALYQPYSYGNFGKALEDIDRYMNSFFADSTLRPALQDNRVPMVDIRETPEGFSLEADLPGYDEKDITVQVDGNVLTIETARQEENASETAPIDAEKEQSRYIIRERRAVSFRRSFQLPGNTDTTGIQAHFKNGVLRLEIKKRPEAQKRRIEIGVGS